MSDEEAWELVRIEVEKLIMVRVIAERQRCISEARDWWRQDPASGEQSLQALLCRLKGEQP